MATTTIKNLRTALEGVINGLTPRTTGGIKVLGRRKYRQASPFEKWEDRPEADIDREFRVGNITRGLPTMFGITSQIDYEAKFEVLIGHAMGANLDDGIDRRDTDIYQIAEELEKKGNYPSGVSLIRLDSLAIEEVGKFWITSLSFNIHFALAAP